MPSRRAVAGGVASHVRPRRNDVSDDEDSEPSGGDDAEAGAVDRGPNGRGPLPASDTKHLTGIDYWLPKLDRTLTLRQVAGNGSTTGSTLWLSSQVLVCLLQSQYDRRKSSERPRVLELGAGIGLTSLVLAHLGWDVVSTDVSPPLDTVVRPNVMAAQSLSGTQALLGEIIVRKYDWVHDDPASLLERGHTPFDLLVTADTVYEPSLVDGLFNTIASLLSHSSSLFDNARGPHKKLSKQRHALIALERRDPQHIDAALERARNVHCLHLQLISSRTVRRAVDAYLGAIWPRSAWDDVEIWIATKAS